MTQGKLPFPKPETLVVDLVALQALLVALSGPDYLVRELQATRKVDPENPINVLFRNYNERGTP